MDLEARAVALRKATPPTLPDGTPVPLPKAASGLASASIRLADDLVMPVAIWARAPLAAEDRRALLTDFRGTHARTLSEASALLPKDAPTPPEVKSALVASRSAVLAEHATDVWTLIRKAMRRDDAQQRLFAKWVAEADPVAGIAAVGEALKRVRPEALATASLDTIRSITELNQVIPEMTTVEAAIVALLERVPETLLKSGDGAVGMLRDLHRDGATFARDDVVLSEGDAMSAVLGASGVGPGEEFVPFRPAAQRLVTKLLTAGMSDAYLLERVFVRQLENGVVRGQGMIAECPDFRFDSVLQKLFSVRKLKSWEKDRTAERLDAYHLAGFVGLLERVPDVLRGPEPFHGFIVPFGAGVKLVDLGGHTREYVSLHPYLQGEAYEDIFSTTHEDVSPSQPLMSALARQLRTALEDQLIEAAAPLSRIEALAADALVDLHVSLPTGGRKFFLAPEHATDASLHEVADTSAGRPHAYGLKMGEEELEHTIEGLRYVPAPIRQLLFPARVTRIVKMQVPDTLGSGMLQTLDRIGAEYQPRTRTVALYDCPALGGPFGRAGEDVRLARRWSMMQELGLALFEALPGGARSVWTENTVAVGGTFPDQDFADTFAAYVLCGADFRERVLGPRPGSLVGKYALMRGICQGVECAGMPGLTLEGVESALKRLMKETPVRANVVDREGLADRRAQRLWSDGRVLSLEQLREGEGRDAEGDPPTLPTRRRRR